jgi:hypothetical protein
VLPWGEDHVGSLVMVREYEPGGPVGEGGGMEVVLARSRKRERGPFVFWR